MSNASYEEDHMILLLDVYLRNLEGEEKKLALKEIEEICVPMYGSKKIPSPESVSAKFSNLKKIDFRQSGYSSNFAPRDKKLFDKFINKQDFLDRTVLKIKTKYSGGSMLRQELLQERAKKKFSDNRQKVLREISKREGQKEFKDSLMENYNGRCAITGSKAEQVLEAAHIIPYSETANNDPENGILLRADIHTLFDKGLIRILDVDYSIEVDEVLDKTEYAEYSGKKIKLPSRCLPSKYALDFKNSNLKEVKDA